MTACDGCGRVEGRESCQDLFMALLALDHSREPPWGPLHGVVVSCFLLQHPGHPGAPAGPDGLLDGLRTYLAGGLSAHAAGTDHARRRNSHRFGSGRPAPPRTPPGVARPPAPTGFPSTIADVAVDGSFPAEGYEDRVRSWARVTVEVWSETLAL